MKTCGNYEKFFYDPEYEKYKKDFMTWFSRDREDYEFDDEFEEQVIKPIYKQTHKE